jgi:hypothetical protein
MRIISEVDTMEQYALFLALKQLLEQYTAQPFTFGFNDVDSNADFDCGIYIQDSEGGEYRDLTGGYRNRIARVQFSAISDLTSTGNIATAGFMGYIRNLLPQLITSVAVPQMGIDGDGMVIEDPEGVYSPAEVVIIKTKLITGVIPLGKQSQGRAEYSLNALITFIVKEVS